MKKLTFKNQDQMPILGLGTWKSKPEEVYNAVLEAIKAGYRHIDCSPIYGNEIPIGKALQTAFSEGIVKREDLWITSKLWCNAHKEDEVIPALKKTLEDLQLDYLNLYLIHWPIVFKSDVIFPEKGEDFVDLNIVPVAETWQGMEACVEHGLCRHIGVSNFSIRKLKDLIEISLIKPEVNQIEMHPYLAQNKMVDFCKKEQILLTAYSPLGSGKTTAQKNALLEDPTLIDIAAKHNCSPAQILIKWSIQRNIAVIPKSVTPERIKENMDVWKISLDNSDMEDIATLDLHFRYIDGSFWLMENSPYTLENLWDE